MKTDIDPELLKHEEFFRAQGILGQCTNCGCCNAVCPTYELTGDEREAPRGRINLIREMVERGGQPHAETVEHIDSCLSCLTCTVVCPSGVDYMHLVDFARVQIEKSHPRPVSERLARRLVGGVLPEPERFRAAARAGQLAKPLGRVLGKATATRALGAMLEQAPSWLPPRSAAVAPGVHATKGARRKRVIVPTGCVQSVLDPETNRSAIRLLNALGIEAVVPGSAECCGALNHHLGQKEAALERMRSAIDAWWRIIDADPVDAIVMTASGCGTTVMDYGHILRDDPAYAGKAREVSRLAVDVAVFLGTLELPPPRVRPGLRVAYQAACSLQHGQRVLNQPKDLLRKAGYTVLSPQDEHLCCGSAGSYSLFHPETARELRDRKLTALGQTRPEVIAGGNIGCLQHLGAAAEVPVVHTVALLEWAWTGRQPQGLVGRPTAAELASPGAG